MDRISNCIVNKAKELTKQQRTAIVFSLIAGLLSHGYAMGNNYIYHDATTLNTLGYTFEIGRWSLGFIGEIHKALLGNFQLPFLNIAISLILLAFSSALVVDCFKIESSFLSGFTGAIISVYPVITSTFAYNFTSAYYFLALLCVVLSVKQIKDSDKIKDMIIAVLLLAFSAGIYQAYLSVAVTLALSIIMVDLIKDELEFQAIVKKGLRYVILFVLSLIAYLIINKISVIIVKPYNIAYQGMESMGSLDIKAIPSRIIQAYLHFFYIKWNGINKEICMWVFILSYLLVAALLIIVNIVKKKLNIKNVVLFILAYAVFPIAVNLVYLMSTNELYSVHTLMRFATVFVILTPAVIIDKFYGAENKASEVTSDNKTPEKLATGFMSVILTVIVLCYIYSNNIAYIKMNLVQEQMTSFFTVLQARISETENFNDDTPIVFDGEYNLVDENLFDINEIYGDTVILGYEYNARDLINRETWKKYMAYHTGFAPDIIDLPADIAATDEYANLNAYPDAGSIKVINGILVVKLSK